MSLLLLAAGRSLLRPPASLLASSPVRTLASRPRDRRPRNGGTPPLNEQLRPLRSVRLVSASGTDEGLMSGAAALARARAAGLDLLQVRAGAPSSPSSPPVVRLLDHAAFEESQRRRRYEASKRKKGGGGESAGATRLKQVRLSPSTGPHDRAIKLRQARGFLADGHRVRVYMQFRRGQGRLKEEAKRALAEVAGELRGIGRLRGVEEGGDVAELFKEPEVEPDATAGAPVRQRPMEIVFEPLAKRLREKARQELEGESG